MEESPAKLRILVADDEPAARFGMARALSHDRYEVIEARDGEETLQRLRDSAPHLVFLDLNMPGRDGLAVLRESRDGAFAGEIVVVTADDQIETAVECMRLGASDYITKPFEVEKLRAVARRAAQRLSLENLVRQLESRLETHRGCGAIVGGSQVMQTLYRQIEKAAVAPVDVLIQGETGTGKELVAREIHRLSGRGEGVFLAVNTAAMTDSLVESELFGHARGAFTGAESDRKGVFEQADGGTLFLDEIGDMPLRSQTKILRTLQERTVQPLGSTRSVAVDVRVISATHQSLDHAVEEGHFRRDLYYRVRGIELRVPPLRERPDDIPSLAEHFLDQLAARVGKPSLPLGRAAMACLLSYHWPGNVRQLAQCVASAAAMAAGEEIEPQDLDLPGGSEDVASRVGDLSGLPLTEAKQRVVEAFERGAIKEALSAHSGNISAAARQLGIHRQSLQQKMAQLGLSRRAARSRDEEKP